MRIPEHFETELRAHKANGLLQEVRPESLPVELMKLGDLSTINLFVISCSDGHQFKDITSHTFNCLQLAKRHYGLEELADDCFHWRTENGGPYVLTVPQLQRGTLAKAKTRRGRIIHVDDSLLFWIEGAMSLKKLNVGLLESHCVCGMTKDIFSSMHQYEDKLAEAKELLMKEYGLGKDRLVCWMQAHGHKGRKTHHLDYSLVQERMAT